MSQELELLEVERILLRGLDARQEILKPLLDQYHQDQAVVVTLIATRLNIPVSDIGTKYHIDSTAGKLIELRHANTPDSQDDSSGSDPAN